MRDRHEPQNSTLSPWLTGFEAALNASSATPTANDTPSSNTLFSFLRSAANTHLAAFDSPPSATTIPDLIAHVNEPDTASTASSLSPDTLRARILADLTTVRDEIGALQSWYETLYARRIAVAVLAGLGEAVPGAGTIATGSRGPARLYRFLPQPVPPLGEADREVEDAWEVELSGLSYSRSDDPDADVADEEAEEAEISSVPPWQQRAITSWRDLPDIPIRRFDLTSSVHRSPAASANVAHLTTRTRNRTTMLDADGEPTMATRFRSSRRRRLSSSDEDSNLWRPAYVASSSRKEGTHPDDLLDANGDPRAARDEIVVPTGRRTRTGERILGSGRMRAFTVEIVGR
ncbi:hypothetical protein HKX48_003981 [Thoreauomyces humboldtii]|nr:hypothetical protein HKX48_003981 [Thoreauomyces humboldtii]